MSRSLPACTLFVILPTLLASCMTPEPVAPPDIRIERVTVVPEDLRPPVMGQNGGVSAGHPLTTAAALEVLQNGGNAFDAGVAALLVGGVVEQDLYSLGGEALVLVFPVDEGQVTSIAGQGWAPRGATIEWYRDRSKSLFGAGLDPAVVPGALHGALTVLERWGTMSFEEVSTRAVEYAANGFPLLPRTAQAIQRELRFLDQWPDNQRFWFRDDGVPYGAGEVIQMPALANTLLKMIASEQMAASQGRVAGIVAARDRFYKGDIAEEMVAFLQRHGAPFELDDFSEFFARIEEPTSTTYKGYTVYKQSFNSQGPALLQMLNILENFDLQAMGHNSADYLHTITEAMKLAYADRDTYYGDPDFVDIPEEGLLSKEYGRERAAQIDMQRASLEFVAGDPLAFDNEVDEWGYWMAGLASNEGSQMLAGVDYPGSWKDTTHIAIIDKDGNVFDSTPSGGWIGGSVILGNTGIPMSVRGEQFWLDETRAAQLRPRSRPRYTLTPSIVLRDGEPFLAIGTPGGDNQEQTILQTFLNIVEFESSWYPNLHNAIAMPRIQTLHFYESFWPHDTGFNRMNAESTVPISVLRDLAARGHEVYQAPPLGLASCATIVMLNPETQTRIAGADARRDCYAAAY
jgi:gamma-glutamyltranspeptidase / glutathione hydrolase